MEEVKKVKKKKEINTTLDTFDVTSVRFQHKMLWDIKTKISQRVGTQVILCSGAVGSGKTLMAAHLIWMHLIENPGANIGIGRKDLKRLRSTLLKPIIKHAPLNWKNGKHYVYNKTAGSITLSNGSMLSCYSWADGDMERFKGEPFTMFVIDECTENDEIVFEAIHARMGREKGMNECIFMLMCNPNEPDHHIYKNIIAKAGYVDGVRREGKDLIHDYHVYYSLTEQNKHNLEDGYIEGLLATKHKKWIERNLEGKWVTFGGDGIYHAYNEDIHYKREAYKVNLQYPIYWGWDFNTAHNKPMSMCMAQFIEGKFHFFGELIMDKSNTHKMMEELSNNGMMDYDTKYIILGDASGWSKQASSNGFCDYDIIEKGFSHYSKKKINYEMAAPRKNPEIKERHNLVNSFLVNGLNQVRLFVYDTCPMLNEGLKLTQLKESNRFVEDDSKNFQHVSTGCGYLINIAHHGEIKSGVVRR